MAEKPRPRAAFAEPGEPERHRPTQWLGDSANQTPERTYPLVMADIAIENGYL